MKKPFFRREKDQGTLQQLDQLESKIDEKKNEIDENTRAILKLEKESKQLDVDSGVMSDEVAYFKD
jgi:septal ring factor EnvC (AmiA/AmiB activator)